MQHIQYKWSSISPLPVKQLRDVEVANKVTNKTQLYFFNTTSKLTVQVLPHCAIPVSYTHLKY